MSSGLRRTGGTTALLLGVVLLGCDDPQNQADKQIRAELAQARHMAMLGSEQAALAQEKLKAAAGDAAASPAVSASAKAAYAQSQLEAAQVLVHQIDRKELELAQLSWEITQLAVQIRTSGAAVAGQKQFDPKPARDAITAKIAQAQGGPDKPAWFTEGKSTIPTLWAVKQELTKLEAEMTQRQERIKTLTDQRARLISEAEQATIQADQLKGDQSLAPYKRVSDLRKQAMDASTEIDTLQFEAKRIQSSLSLARAQETAVSDSIRQLNEQSATLEKTWKEMDAQAMAHQQLGAQILGVPGVGDQPAASAGGSIYQKAAELDRLAKEIQKLRADALVAAGNAAQDFERAHRDAGELAESLRRRINNPTNNGRPELVAWKSLLETMHEMQFLLQQAAAKRAIGEINASAAASMARRMGLKAVVESAVNRVPTELAASDLDTQRQAALADANAAFKESDELLLKIIDGQSTPQLQNTAKIAKALTLYGWAQVARQENNPEVYKARIQEAIDRRNSAAENNAVIPVMPPELGSPPKPVAAETTAEPPATTQAQ